MSGALPVLDVRSAHAPQLTEVDHIVRRGLEQARESRRVAIVRDDGLFMRRAEPADAQEIHELLEQFVAPGMLIPRTLKQVYRTIRDFVVAVEDGRIIGCAALRIYSADVAEIGALAVSGARQGGGIGGRLVEALLHDAELLGLRRVFALTTSDVFFHRLGFETTVIAEFPEKVAADCTACARRAACAEIAVALTIAH